MLIGDPTIGSSQRRSWKFPHLVERATWPSWREGSVARRDRRGPEIARDRIIWRVIAGFERLRAAGCCGWGGAACVGRGAAGLAVLRGALIAA
jgi:hypothetical protein